MSQQDVEEFLWDLERELAHLDGDERRELVKEAEDRIHELATGIAEAEEAEHVRWYHYVQASAELGPPERLAAELTGEPLPDRETTHRWMYGLAAALVLVIAGMIGYAYFTTGDLEPLGSWSGEPTDFSGQETMTVNVSKDADSVFLSFRILPNTQQGNARVTVLDGANTHVYEGRATFSDHLETSRFVEGEPGTWRIFVDFERFSGAWNVTAKQEMD